MFGYIVTNQQELLSNEKRRYREAYCGLCHTLGEAYGTKGRRCLSYDITFLSILLSSLYELPETRNCAVCVRHPFSKQSCYTTEVSAYAADMNIVISYYQCLDDWHDDHKAGAKKRSEALKPLLPGILKKWPRQSIVIAQRLEMLSMMEKRNELNPDLPANCFGSLLGELFVWREDGYEPVLRAFGSALGRFIYLLDAVNDLKGDLKKSRYNPLVAQTAMDYTQALTMIIGECTAAFDKLPLKRDLHILHNILYSGIWQKYRSKKREGRAESL
ncbi:MAG: DUF5685 family protein [Treponema sp.]|jgi:hypothetical protein|nr:DUF5685 family protein [Treponema sp.]